MGASVETIILKTVLQRCGYEFGEQSGDASKEWFKREVLALQQCCSDEERHEVSDVQRRNQNKQ
jgi:hypothetical protein